MRSEGKNAEEIAIDLYEHAVGPVDRNYRDVDIRFITGLVDRYLNDMSSAEIELLARERHAYEVKARRAERNAELEEKRQRQQVTTELRRAERIRREQELAEVKRQLEIEQTRVRDARRQRWENDAAQFPAWRDRNWEDLLPKPLAGQQAAWCRRKAVRRMREAGLSWKEVGYRMRVTPARARQLADLQTHREKYRSISPLERWLAYGTDFDRAGQAKRALRTVEGWTGRETVPRCSWYERDVWELYYSMRENA